MPHASRRTFALTLSARVAAVLAAGALAAAPWAPAHAAGRTVELTLNVQAQANNGYNYSGFAKGTLTVTVPMGSQVEIHFTNTGALTHSLMILPSAATQPAVGPAAPAFTGAATSNPQAGLPVKSSATVTFTASKAGNYEIACGVAAHALLGMWDHFVVSASGAPSVSPSSAAAAVGLKVH